MSKGSCLPRTNINSRRQISKLRPTAPIDATRANADFSWLDNGIDRVDRISADGRLIEMNAAGRDRLDVTLAENPNSRWAELWAPDQQAFVMEQLGLALAGQPTRFTASSVGVSGISWWDVVLSRAPGDGAIAQARDVTDVKNSEADYRFRARHDGLTGLLNRTSLKDQIDLEVARSVAAATTGAVLMLDLDNFKLINDTLGHDAGDAVLKSVASSLAEVLDPRCSVARLGGDEFAIILPEIADLDAVRYIVEAVLERLGRPIEYNGRTLNARASIGAALLPKHGRSAAELLKHADIALYAAKAFGRGGYVMFVPSMGGPIRRRAAAAAMVRAALAENRVESIYEPMVELHSGRLLGFEAKLQLRLPDGSAMDPVAITPVYDDVELAQQLGGRILTRVTEDARSWRNAGLAVTRIAVNASAAEFRAGDYAERFLARIAQFDLPASLFEIEIAETVFAGRGTDYVASALAKLSAAGVRVSLDAFGTGPASLSHLKRLPVSGIKIDQSFVEAVESDAGDSAIVRAMIGLANGFGISLGADGVTTLGQAQTLRNLGCEVGQGMLFGAAAPASAMGEMLAAARTAYQPSPKMVAAI